MKSNAEHGIYNEIVYGGSYKKWKTFTLTFEEK